jgi:hypothetical protein
MQTSKRTVTDFVSRVKRSLASAGEISISAEYLNYIWQIKFTNGEICSRNHAKRKGWHLCRVRPGSCRVYYQSSIFLASMVAIDQSIVLSQ